MRRWMVLMAAAAAALTTAVTGCDTLTSARTNGTTIRRLSVVVKGNDLPAAAGDAVAESATDGAATAQARGLVVININTPAAEQQSGKQINPEISPARGSKWTATATAKDNRLPAGGLGR